MVWKTRKGRHRKSKTTPSSSPGLPKAQNLKSCLKSNGSQSSGYGGDSAARGTSRSSTGSAGGTRESGEYMRDHSTKSARSYFSGYSSSSGGAQSEGNNSHLRYTESPGSGNSNLLSQSHFNRTMMEKKVRFGNIQLREHERAVGDNPSCSTGPPVGIGWRHSETKIINIDEFERERVHKPKCNVLSRSKREELLLDWGISFNDIIDAIRTNIKVKNQRRQTVTNLGKIERIEEALESATRKIKRAFLLRKPTGRKAKQLQQQAQVVAAREFHALALGNIHVDELEELRKTQDSPASDEGVHEPDVGDSIESDPKFRKMASSLSLSEIDDHLSSGLSLGNSATTSVREIEQFYRDLEMEMFGDLPLPDMVGETLEVPSLYIPEEERMYHDPTSGNYYPEPRSVAYDDTNEICESAPRSYPQHMNNFVHTSELAPGSYIIPPNAWNDPNFMPPSMPVPYNMGNGGVHFGNGPVLTRGIPVLPTPNPRAEIPPPQRDNPSPTQDQGLSSSLQSTERQQQQQDDKQGLSSSLHSTERRHLEKQQADMTRMYLAHTVTAMEQRYLHPSLAPPPPPPVGYDHGTSPSPASSGDSKQGKRDHHRGSSSRRRDGPEIRHIPFSYHSPAYWMADGPRIAFQQFEPVTITEDSGRGVLEASPSLRPTTQPRPPMSGGPIPKAMPVQMPMAMPIPSKTIPTVSVPPPQATTTTTKTTTTTVKPSTPPSTTTIAASPTTLGSSPPLKSTPLSYSSAAPDLIPSPPDVKVPLYVAPARFPSS